MSPRDNGDQQGRSVAEWTTLGVSVAIILLLIGLVGYLFLNEGDKPAIIEVTPMLSATRQVNGTYYVPVEVTNRGSRTVEQLRARVVLMNAQGQLETAEIEFDFLASGATDQAVVVFGDDPSGNTVTGQVVSYLVP